MKSYTTKAIEKAIKGGYDFEHYRDYMAGGNASKAVHLLQIDFWKCLCKELGLTGEKIRMCGGCGVALKWNENPTMDGKHGGKNGCGSDIEEYEGQWLIEMHRFIDHLAEKKSVDSFFKYLITSYA